MPILRKVIRWEKHMGEPIQVENVTVTPVSQSLVIRVPYFHLSWNRPAAVYVDDGQAQRRIPIFDTTRITQLGVVTAALMSAGLLWAMSRGR